MSIDWYQTLQFIFLAAQFVTLIVFVYYVIKYAQNFGKNGHNDKPTMWCFIFVFLTLFTKITLRSIALLGMNLQGYTFSAYTSRTDLHGDDFKLCCYNISGQASNYFFNLALFVNALRWLILVAHYKDAKISDLSDKMAKFIIFIFLSFLTLVSCYEIGLFCSYEVELSTLKLSIILVNVTILFLCIFALIMFSYSCYFFQ